MCRQSPSPWQSISVCAIAALPDGRIVSRSWGDHTVKLWDPATGAVQTMNHHTNSIRAVVALPDGALGFKRGLLALDPDGHPVRVVEH